MTCSPWHLNELTCHINRLSAFLGRFFFNIPYFFDHWLCEAQQGLFLQSSRAHCSVHTGMWMQRCKAGSQPGRAWDKKMSCASPVSLPAGAVLSAWSPTAELTPIGWRSGPSVRPLHWLLQSLLCHPFFYIQCTPTKMHTIWPQGEKSNGILFIFTANHA